MIIRDALARFDRQLRADDRLAHTVSYCTRDLRLLASLLGDVDVQAITPNHISRFILSASVQKQADGTPKAAISVNHVRTAVRMFCRYLAETGVLDRNPAAALKVPSVGSAPVAVLTAEEQGRLLATMAAFGDVTARRDHALFSVLLSTGLRVSSAVGLDVRDLDLERSRLAVTVKGGRRESVVLSTRMRDLLAGFVEGREGPVFVSNQGRRISLRQVQTRLRYWLDAAGIETAATVHSLRHAVGTKIYEATGDVHLVATALHHRNVSTPSAGISWHRS